MPRVIFQIVKTEAPPLTIPTAKVSQKGRGIEDAGSRWKRSEPISVRIRTRWAASGPFEPTSIILGKQSLLYIRPLVTGASPLPHVQFTLPHCFKPLRSCYIYFSSRMYLLHTCSWSTGDKIFLKYLMSVIVRQRELIMFIELLHFSLFLFKCSRALHTLGN